MVYIKPFQGIRPVKDKVKDIASPPYDVINKQEAKEMAGENQLSFLHVIKPEIDFPDDFNVYSPEIYKQGKENFGKLMDVGIFNQDSKDNFYVYAQTMHGRTQYGLVACASVKDYMEDYIKKHELTRPDKEEDRMNHIRVSNLNYEPVFFTYPAHQRIDELIGEVIKSNPEYDFISDDDITHTFWVIDNEDIILEIQSIFEKEIPYTYVADGHHRTAAAALVGNERKENNPDHKGNEEYNYFLAVHFPDNQLSIFDYNRVVKDLNGHSAAEFIDELGKRFDIEEKGDEAYKPARLHEFSMYLEGKWYRLQAKENTYDENDPIGVLDVTVLTSQVLEPLLGITDLRRDKRIDFVGGIRGLGELKKRVDSGEMKVAFALYPVSMQQLINIADTGNIMPPKTTWFEPKLRSGLVLHSLE